MKCLIVDDETSIRQSLRMMGRWTAYGIDTVLEAENGREALDVITAHRPEIMITDMKMEAMDGVGLLKCLEEWTDPPQVVVVSGYSDYSFMHSAISLGAADYILKPVSVERFNEGIERAIQKWRKVHTEADTSAESRDISIHSAMVDEISAYPTVQGFVGTHSSYLMFSFRVISFSKVCTEQFGGVPDLLYYAMQNDLEKQFEGSFEAVILRLLGGSVGTMTGLIALDEGKAGYVRAERMLLCALEKIAVQYQICMAVGVSAEASGSDALNGALREVNGKISRARLAGRNGICTEPVEVSNVPEVDEEQLRIQLLNGDASACTSLVMNHLKMLKATGALSFHTFNAAIRVLFRLITTQLAAREAQNVPDDLQINHLRFELEQAICSFGEIEKKLLAFLEPCCSSLVNSNTLIHRMRDYIDEHYSEKLGLDSLSKTFFISREYASRIFKKEMGTTFINYLTDVRLERVCHFLRYTDDSIAVIADKTGFKESAYLIRVFQKKYNMTPKEFRRSHKQK